MCFSCFNCHPSLTHKHTHTFQVSLLLSRWSLSFNRGLVLLIFQLLFTDSFLLKFDNYYLIGVQNKILFLFQISEP